MGKSTLSPILNIGGSLHRLLVWIDCDILALVKHCLVTLNCFLRSMVAGIGSDCHLSWSLGLNPKALTYPVRFLDESVHRLSAASIIGMWASQLMLKFDVPARMSCRICLLAFSGCLSVSG